MARNQTKPAPTGAVAYIRVSTDRQELGAEAQRASITKWASSTGQLVIGWHEDHLSGTLTADQRPALLGALAAITEFNAAVLVVARRDRLARDVVIAAVIERLVERAGARIVSAAGEGSEDPTPGGQLFRVITDAFAQYEVATIRNRTKAALAARKARGLRVGGIPWGFTADSSGRLWPAPKEQHTIGRIVELIAVGHTVTEITQTLAREGHTSRGGRSLPRSKVGAICARIRRNR